MRLSVLYPLFAAALGAKSQDSIPPVRVSGYVECYYTYDPGSPGSVRQPFFVSHNRHGSFNLNLGFLQVDYSNSKVRGTLSLMAGTYAGDNLASEPFYYRNVKDAFAGVRLSRTTETWLDAGIFPSHIGFESAVGLECGTLTRSMAADNTPYYESGLRLSHRSGQRDWYLTLLVLNGWQRMQPQYASTVPAFGTQLLWTKTDRLRLNWSTYAGNQGPAGKGPWRFYSNLYAEVRASKRTFLTIGFDAGMQQMVIHGSAYNGWYSPQLVLRQMLGEKFAVAARSELFYDPNYTVINVSVPGGPFGFRTAGHSVNFDYLPARNAMLRIEARALNSLDRVFVNNRTPAYDNYFFTAAVCVAF